MISRERVVLAILDYLNGVVVGQGMACSYGRRVDDDDAVYVVGHGHETINVRV